jgi:Periplasmic serine proteases (ClpP class)
MRVSSLLSAITRKAWFIRESDALAQDVIIAKLLGGEYSVEAFSKIYSDSNPLKVLLDNGHKVAASSSSFNDAPAGSTAIIQLQGTMLKYGTWCSYGTTEIADAITEAANSPKINSIVIDADSGGGAVDAIAPIFDAIICAQKCGKPVVACVDLMASACVYALLPCDQIIAGNNISCEVGSIGVMMQFQDMIPYLKEQGIITHSIYSSLSDYKNRPYELAKEGKYDEIISEELDPLARQFQNAVKQYRPGLDQSVPGILAGKMFYADQAKQYGLIDQVGSLDMAIAQAQDLANGGKYLINNYVQSKS